ncbi:MAG: rhodanese-like domain-containing protein [Actinobacteria bacterium]|nr:rhodanese-like domain-containing protein [Actinomycetota bacterium]
MRLIARDELKARLDRGDDFRLVNALGGWAHRAKHIPGSLNFATPEESLKVLKRDEDIVVYCSNPKCIASISAYLFLESHGYAKVTRYAGGIEDWDAAGYPLEGTMIR